MKRFVLLLIMVFIISNLFSQISVDPKQSLNVQESILNTPYNHPILNATAAGAKTRDLIGYNIYIDGVFIGFFDQFFIELFYGWFDPGQSYIIGIEEVHTNGTGQYIEFIYIYNPALNSVEDFFVTSSGYVSWDPPNLTENSRDLLGYNVYLNVDFVTFTTDLFYQYDENNLIEEQLYFSGVTAVYDEGESSTEFDSFNYLLYNPMIEVTPDEINVTLDPEEITYEDLSVSNPGSDILIFETAVNYLSGNSWISLNPSTFYLEAGETIISSVPISSIGLINTTVNAEIIFENNVGPEIVVPVEMIVNDSLSATTEYMSEITQISNHPNPFNPSTTISFSIKQNSDFVNLEVYNMRGQKIKTLANKEFSQGPHSIIWNGDDESGKSVSSGIYYYNLKVDGKTEVVNKCLLLK